MFSGLHLKADAANRSPAANRPPSNLAAFRKRQQVARRRQRHRRRSGDDDLGHIGPLAAGHGVARRDGLLSGGRTHADEGLG
jgi:hypothetical protein